MGMPVAPVFDLDTYRFRDSVTDPASLNTAFDAGDTAANNGATLEVDTLYRVRFMVQQTVTNAVNHADLTTNFVVQYRNGVGAWTDLGADGGGTEDVEFDNSANFAHSDATTQLLGSGSFVTGDGLESDPSPDIAFTENPGAVEETELEFAFLINGAQVANNDTLELRLLYSAGNETPPATVVPTTNVPTITVSKVEVTQPYYARTGGVPGMRIGRPGSVIGRSW